MRRNHAAKKLFWAYFVLLLAGLAALEVCYPGAVPVLREITLQWNILRLNRDDPQAARVLGEIGRKARRAVPALIKALDVSRPEVVRGTASWALGQMGPEAVPALMKALDSSDREARYLAARALGDMGSPAAEAAIASLVRIQKEDRERDGQPISGALAALGKIGERGLEPFITDLGHKDPQVREQAAVALGRILVVNRSSKLAQKSIEPLINTLQDENLNVRNAAAMALQSVIPRIVDPDARTKAAEALIRTIISDAGTAPYAVGALLGVAERDLESILTIIENADVRGQRVDPPVESPTSRGPAVERLIRIMADREALRMFGAAVLSKIGESALEPLIIALQDEDVRRRTVAAMALQQVLPAIKDPEARVKAVKPLIRALNDRDNEVRGFSPVALVKIGESALEPLINALQDEDVRMRRAVAMTLYFALSEIKDLQIRTRATEPLIGALKDADPVVRGNAALALEKIDTPAAKEAVRNAGFEPANEVVPQRRPRPQ